MRDIDNDTDNKTDNKKAKTGTTITETLLEFVQTDNGTLVLRESHNKDEVLVSIDFSPKVKEMLGSDTQYIGEAMIQAAMAAVMQRQMSHYHANVFDEEPVHYS